MDTHLTVTLDSCESQKGQKLTALSSSCPSQRAAGDQREYPTCRMCARATPRITDIRDAVQRWRMCCFSSLARC